jgi:hypothetical protein
MSRAPTAAFLSDRLRFRAVCAWLCTLSLRPALLPATPSPRRVGVVHDHIQLGQDEIVAITYIVVRIGAGDIMHAGTAEGGEIVGRSSGGGELSSVEGAGEMISDGSADANRKVLVKRA